MTATLISVVMPGGGHLYAEDKRRGVALLSLAGVGIAIAIWTGQSSPTLPGLIAWWYGVIDAHNAVERYNRRRTSRLSVVPNITARQADKRVPGPGVGIGLKLRW